MREQRPVVGLVFALIGAAFLSSPYVAAQTAPETPAAIEAGTEGNAPEAQPSANDTVAPGGVTPESGVTERQESDGDTAASEQDPPAQDDDAQPQTSDTAENTGTESGQEPSVDGGEPAGAQPSANDANAEARSGASESQPALAEQPAAEKAPRIDPKDVTLTIATWAGAYGQAQELALFEPFKKRFGYQLKTVAYDGDYDALEGQGDDPDWSVVDLNGEALVRACDENLLERLDHSFLESSPDGAPLSEDFLPGAVTPCGIASSAWSAIVVYDQRLTVKPASIQDFFDTNKIAGKRLLPKRPRYSLELALMADGVAPEDVYQSLATAAGQDRAFAKLSSIKDDIIWWEKPSEVFEQVAQNKAVMGLAFNGRAFMAIVGAKQPLEILWDHQIYTYDYWAIPRGAKHAPAAKEFIRFATSPGPLSDQARWIPYGPARRSALPLVGKHAELNLDMKPYLPTSEANFVSALAFDGAFWRANEQALGERFAEWVEGRQLPVQKEAALAR